jgi:DNA repair protein RecN (Recombination protein N)
MLFELYIRNFAIIDELRLRFDPGFNVLTGETGAGKSIILDAVMLLLGGRADTAMVRSGCEEAYVEAAFSLGPELQAAVTPLLAEEGLDEESDSLLLARELRLSGRNICRVNGRAVSLNILRQVAEPLIDIHGQGEHLSLLRPRSHLPLLDSYAGSGLIEERAILAREVSQWQKIQRELKELRQNERAIAQRLDMLQFQIQEIGAANLRLDEEEELRAERTRLANAEQLIRSATEVIVLLNGLDHDAQSITDMLGQAERALSQLVRYDATQAPRLERVQGIVFQVSELAAELQYYLDELEFSPGRLDYVEERLELIHSLKRKYGENVAAVLALRDRAIVELDQISHSEERIAALEMEQEHYLRYIGELALALSQKRKAAAQRLAAAVEQQLADLNMAGARFSVDFTYEPAGDGAYVGEQRLAFDQSGIDQVEFLISTNPGEPLKPMARVASGGETARLMLALKTALAQVDATPTLIFDEIDQGIGGRVGDVVGRKLWGLTAVAQHQVIVVTHLPQLAGYGNSHFHVSKQTANGRTTTIVVNLDTPGRIHELAAMLGTQGEHAIGGAESILQQATREKKRLKEEG